MKKYFAPLLFLSLCFIVIFTGGHYLKDDVYDVGDEEVSLEIIPNTNSYIDQYERLWSIVKVSPNIYKAIPSGNNKCLLEEIKMHPFFEKEADLAKYIEHDGRCRLKETPFENYTFEKSTNEKITFTYSVCPSGYEEKGYCEKVAQLAPGNLNDSVAVN